MSDQLFELFDPRRLYYARQLAKFGYVPDQLRKAGRIPFFGPKSHPKFLGSDVEAWRDKGMPTEPVEDTAGTRAAERALSLS